MKKNIFLRFAAASLCACVLGATIPTGIHAAESAVSITGNETVGSGLEGSQMAILYDSSIGMPTSEANAIAQTDDGFIWIGSYSGLVRYDGSTFYRYDSSTGISNVISLFVDSKDRLWIGTNDSGLALFEDGTFKSFNSDTDLNSASIRSIAEDDKGNIYAATTAGLYYVDSSFVLHRVDDDRINELYIYAIHSGPDGTIYANSKAGDLFTVKDQKVDVFYPASDFGESTVYSILPDPAKEGYAYVGMADTKIYYGSIDRILKDHKIYDTKGQTGINAMLFTKNRLWVCTGDGIGYFTDSKTYTPLEEIAMNNSVGSVMEDYENNLWFTSSRQGVMKLTSSIFTNVNRYDELPEIVVNSTCIFNNRLYVGTDTGLMILNRKLKQQTDEITEMLSGTRIRSLKADSRGNLWICTYGDYGLVCLHSDNTYDIYNEQNTGLLSNWVRTACELSNGIIAVSASGGVNFIKDGQITATFDQSKGISNTEILTICEDINNDELYLGSDGGGIYVLNAANNKVDHLGIADGLTSEVILRIKYDKYRNIHWIITSNSIAYMKDKKITTVTSFPYANNFDIFFNDKNDIWVLSSAGIFVVDADEMMADENLVYEKLDSESGLPYVTTANSRSYIDENGMLYICGTAGITMVNINEQIHDLSSIKLCLPFVGVDDEIVYPDADGNITIPSDCKRLTIYPYALSYALNNPKVSYCLEGFDENDFVTTKRELSEVTYTNLNGGKYNFHLDLMSADDKSIVKSVNLNITKEMAWYEHVFARVLIVALFVLLIITLIYFYFKRKSDAALKKSQETRELINEITRAFAKTIDMKDRYTNGHSFRVANYTRMLAEKLGYNEDQVADMYNIALLHDIGKLAIPDAILNKPEGLNDEEYAIMKSHAEKGYEVLKEITIAPDLAIGAGYHHERLDGKGYPRGVKKDEIPYVAQIIAVADTFDAMYSTRPYRKQLPIQTVLDELKRVAGSQLNEEVVTQLIALADEGKIK